ncbi:helix-turn-helix transcriptional regulator [Parvibaculaceae bacterium PLY_AMNH_Bact1]|nr:helix-turn-helix transcriptional regulator [Parvibaculaceae bacterium PLY_AMNH_Bact1]
METAHSQSAVGVMLKEWRAARGLSQLALACDADISPRHLSFVETGRAQPSREMVLTLADTLEVPLREQNALLIAAGFPAAFTEADYDSPEMSEIRNLVDLILSANDPFCAAAIDRHWNILSANQTYWATTGGDPDPTQPKPNLLKRMFAPGGFRDLVTNWDDVAYPIVQRLHREAIAELSRNETSTRDLLDELMRTYDLPAQWKVIDIGAQQAPLVPVTLEVGDKTIHLVTTITTLGTAQDVTLQEIRIESFLPADQESRDNWLAIFENA